MLKYAKIVNEETKACSIGTGTNKEFYKSIGMELMDVEQAYNGVWYLAGHAPERPAPTKEEIARERELRYIAEADPLKMDYDEATARGDDNAEELKAAWLSKKDEIRAELPYPMEESEVSDV